MSDGNRGATRLPVVAGCVAVSLTAVAFYLIWEIAHRTLNAYDTSIYAIDPADEWRYTACSRLALHGYAMFSQVFSAQPPLLFASLAASMGLSSQTVAGARWDEIFFGLIALISVAWIAYQLAGPIAGAAGAALLAVSPGFLAYSHTVEAESPMMALAGLSLALVLTYAVRRGALESTQGTGEAGYFRPHAPAVGPLAYRSQGGRAYIGPQVFSRIRPFSGAFSYVWLVLGGLALAAAILMKLFAVETVLPALYLVALIPLPASQKIRDAGVYLFSASVPVVLDFVLIAPGAQWRQVIQLHNAAASANLPDVTPPLQILGNYLGLDLGLTMLAATSLVFLFSMGRLRLLGFLLLWTVGTGVMLVLFRPLFPHHPAILAASLAVTAGTAIPDVVQLLRGWRRPALLVAVGIIAYLILTPRLVHADRHLVYAGPPAVPARLVTYIKQHTNPQQLVATDDLNLADAAHRLVPPPLCDPSNVRLYSGYLTSADLISATRQYRPFLVIPYSGIYAHDAAYLTWLDKHYVKHIAVIQSHVQGARGHVTVYFRH